MDGIWNRYNLKSTRRIYTFDVLKCTEIKNDWTYTSTPSYAFIASTGTPLNFNLYRVVEKDGRDLKPL